MSSFTVLLLCIQACLVQNIYTQAYLGAYGPAMTPAFAAPCVAYDGLAYPATGFANAYPAASFAGPYLTAGCGSGLAAYGGSGEGNVAIAGELPVAGTTAIAGQVPIIGAVSFSGPVATAGAVSIAGKCACGCGSPYY